MIRELFGIFGKGCTGYIVLFLATLAIIVILSMVH